MKRFLIVFCMIVMLSIPVMANGVEIGVSQLKSGVFYDFNNFYGGGLLPVMNYKKLVSADLGFITGNSKNYISGGLSLNIETACQLLKWNYMLPGAVEVGLSFAKNLNQKEKLKCFLYAGLTWNLEK